MKLTRIILNSITPAIFGIVGWNCQNLRTALLVLFCSTYAFIFGYLAGNEKDS